MIEQSEYAQIEYHGILGVTSDCLNSIVRLIHFGDKILKASLLTNTGEHSSTHCFLLSINYGDDIAIKSGFSSGYGGEGPRGLSTALQLLKRHDADIEEYEVEENVINDIDDSCLRKNDLDKISAARPIRPSRWYDYLLEDDQDIWLDNNKIRYEFPAAIPYRIIDSRIIDLAIKFEEHPDNSIISGYRRLEDIVRKRASLKNISGSKLFSKVFLGKESILYWDDIDESEQIGRGSTSPRI